MLGFLAALILGASGSFAQPFTPVPHNFPATTVGASSVNSMAANGYGVWEADESGTPLWRLAGSGNGTLNSGSDDHGITSGQDTKVATNLLGSVRYVCIDNAGDGFLVSGFNDAQVGGAPASHNINIAIPYSASVNILNNPSTGSVITGSEFNYTPVNPISTAVSGEFGQPPPPNKQLEPVGTGATHTPIDWDIAMDGHYLYIVWHHIEPNTDQTFTGDEIFVTCVQLSNGTVPTGFPMVLHWRGPGSTDGVGTQPTVACDVRNNSSGTFNPACEIAYLDDATPAAIHHVSIALGAQPVFETLPTDVLIPADPTLPGNSPNPYTIGTIPPIDHVRIMEASYAGTSKSGVIGYYVMAGTTEAESLYFFDEVGGQFLPGGGTSYGWYVDGNTLPQNSIYPLPEPQPLGGYADLYVPQYQIVAFANPYDGQNNGNYDEFHCIYVAAGHAGDGLMIVRGADNGMPWPTPNYTIPYSTDSRAVVNQNTVFFNDLLLGYPSDYCAAVNQAGIHIQWYDNNGGGWLYNRDRRSYDEPIEENTIMSADNYVADGSSTGANHGGTLGAQTKPGKIVILDPGTGGSINFGNAGTPVLNANGAGLTIGTTSGSDAASKLILFPGFSCDFQSPPLTANRNFIKIAHSGSCDCYGGSCNGGGDVIVDNNGTLSLPIATFNIMPATLAMNNNGIIGYPRLTSSYGTIALMSGTGADHNPLDNGVVTINGAFSLNNATVSCSAQFFSPLVKSVTLNGETGCPFTSSATNSTITDILSGGQASFYLNDPLTEVDFYQSTFSGVGLSGQWNDHTSDSPVPSRPVSVTYCTFDKIPAPLDGGIHFWRIPLSQTNIDYYFVLDNNTFENFSNPGSDGIYLENFSPNIPGDLASDGTQIDISSNDFTHANNTFDTSHVEAAIHLDNTSAVVDDNTISGKRTNGTSTYGFGIWLRGGGEDAPSNSLICSNTISYVGFAPLGGVETGGGISTSFWKGYEKNNQISYSAQGGILSDHDDNANIIFANYHDNQGPGINNISSDHTSFIEMRGVIHSDHVGDIAGYSIIKNNNSDNNSSSGEVGIASDVHFHIGNETGAGPIAYGFNSFEENSNTDKLFFRSPSAYDNGILGNGNGTPDQALDNNYYEVAGAYYTPQGSYGDAEFPNIGWNSETSPSLPSVLHGEPTPPYIYCYGGHEIIKQIKDKPTAIASTDTASEDECAHLQNEIAILSENGLNQQEYDTAKAYLTLCYYQNHSEATFWDVESANVSRNDDLNRYAELREWLKSVLYLRQDTLWYCNDVEAIIGSFNYYPGHIGSDFNAMEAVIRYILENDRCDSVDSLQFANTFSIGHWTGYPGVILGPWRDTVQDSSIEPKPDTTVPSIDSLGLSILRGPQYAGVSPTPIAPGEDHVTGLYATENPFTQSTAIKFTLADYGLVTFQLFDVLGHAVTTNGIGQVLYPGEHEFDIDGSKLPPGNYIARVAFHNGDVESIMVVRK